MLDELEVMARTIFGEARGESFKGQVAVAWVIKNRSVNRGLSVKDVCYAPKQFSCWNVEDPNREKMLAATFTDSHYLRAFGIAALVSLGDLKDPTDGADHYHTTAIEPYWAKSMHTTLLEGHHRFLRA